MHSDSASLTLSREDYVVPVCHVEGLLQHFRLIWLAQIHSYLAVLNLAIYSSESLDVDCISL